MSLKRTILRFLACSLVASSIAVAQDVPSTGARYAPTDPLPVDQNIKIGRLPNGLTYYIRKNAKPAKRAELRLVVGVGSTAEDDDQRGLAHFIEHMAFNGTKKFPKHELTSYLESLGMRFGADVNASTSFDVTAYMFRIPTDSAGVLPRAFDVLGDVANGITFDSAEIEAERGVVLGEMLSRSGDGSRVEEAQIQAILEGSRYVDRSPIGTTEVLTHATRDKFLRFYKDWYRPNLMAVVAIGDFDPVEVEALIRERFSGLTNPPNERPRPVTAISDNTGTRFSIITDSTITSSRLMFFYKQPSRSTLPASGPTVNDLRASIIQQVFTASLNQRLRDLARFPDAPFASAGVGYEGLGQTRSVLAFTVDTRANELMGGARAMLIETERMARFGLTAVELEHAKAQVRSFVKTGELMRNNVPSNILADECMKNFLGGALLIDLAVQRNIVEEILKTITSDDIQQKATGWRTPDNRIIMALLPDRHGIVAPDTTLLLSIANDVLRRPLTAYEDPKIPDGSLLEREPTPGRIVERKELPQGLTQWVLSNGVRVILRPNSETITHFNIVGTSPGGYSQAYHKAGNKDWATASNMVDIVSGGGLGNFDGYTMAKRLFGSTAHVSADVTMYGESVQGSASLTDAETMFRLLYLQFTAPQLDTVLFQKMRSRIRRALADASGKPVGASFGDTVKNIMTQGHPLMKPIPLAALDSVDGYRALSMYRDRFANAADFNFVITGAFIPDSIAPFVERYLAALPSMPNVKEKPYDLGVRLPKGVFRKTVLMPKGNKAMTVLNFFGTFDGTRQEEWRINAVAAVLRMRLFERLREEMSGTYGVGVSPMIALTPTPEYQLAISFISEPHRADEMAAAAIAVVDTLRMLPATELEVRKIRLATLRDLEDRMPTDEFWINMILAFQDRGFPFTEIGDDRFPRTLTGEDIQRAAQRYTDPKRNFGHFTMRPKGK